MGAQRNGCLFGWLTWFLGGSRRAAERRGSAGMPAVRVNQKFVTDAERNFFQVLRRVVGDRGHVLAQVSLRQLIYLPGTNRTNPGKGAWQNKVAQKAVDFVVCDAATLRPLLVIELDDATHARPDRQSRDEDVRTILDAAGLPRLGVLTSRTYDTRELEAALAPHLPPAPGPTRK